MWNNSSWPLSDPLLSSSLYYYFVGFDTNNLDLYKGKNRFSCGKTKKYQDIAPDELENCVKCYLPESLQTTPAFIIDNSIYIYRCTDIASRYDYTVEYSGIGQAPADSTHLGCCSQAAVFTRKSPVKTQLEEGTSVDSYSLVNYFTFKNKDFSW